MNTDKNHFMLSDTLYEFFKRLVQVILPAFSSLYFGLASIWGLPGAEQVVGTLALVATFFGVVVGVSNRQYHNSGAAYDGSMIVSKSETGPKVFTLELDGDPNEIEDKDSIQFKVCSDETDPPVVL